MNTKTFHRSLEALPASLKWRVAGATDGTFAPSVAVHLAEGWPARNALERRQKKTAVRLARWLEESPPDGVGNTDFAHESRRKCAVRRRKRGENG